MFGAIANLASGFFNRKSQKEANSQSLALARENMGLQREFAQHGVRWKVEDAKQAGIHPLFALGASTHSFSPVSAGVVPENGLAEGMANAGQNIQRSIEATRTADERHQAKLQEFRGGR